MKTKLIVLFASLFITVSGLSAQNRQRQSPEEGAKNQSEALAKNLSLSDEQKQQVYGIILKFANERRANMQASEDQSREQRMELFQKLQQQQNDSIKTVLTDEQKTKYDEFLKEMQSRMQNRQGGPRGEGRGGFRGDRPQQ
ncbi:MAG: hypothetical protein LBR34_10980 [Prevotella sp.]|jgi:Spy/CpxP family protein refolding chaperone|nr:hypothetical protein [Prevotella sp.]